MSEGDRLQSISREVSVLLGYRTTLLGGWHVTVQDSMVVHSQWLHIMQADSGLHKQRGSVTVCGVPLTFQSLPVT